MMAIGYCVGICGSLVFYTVRFSEGVGGLGNVAGMVAFALGDVRNDTIRLNGWDACFVSVSFMECFALAFHELRLFAMEDRGMGHRVGDDKVPSVLTTCILARS